VLFFAACNPKHKSPSEEPQRDVTEWLAELEKIDSGLAQMDSLDKKVGWDAFAAFRTFARKNPKHPLAPTYKMKAAEIARNIPGKSLMAIKEYTEVYQKYPKDSLAPQAQFMVGFTFDQVLHDRERATKAYNAFIDAWPEHPLAAQARDLVALLTTGKDDLEQVKQWQKQPKK
jgi:TolA-binding protein